MSLGRPVSSAPTLPHQGPGDLTLSSIVLFTLGAYGVAAGAATGEEAVVAVGVFAFTLFVVGIVWPVAALARLEVEASAPPDATVGDTVQLRVRLHGRAPRVEIRALDPAGAWQRTSSPASGVLPHVAARRGVFRVVRIQLRTSAPLGVFVRTRTLRVELGFPISVAPHGHTAAPVLHPIPDQLITTSASVLATRRRRHGAVGATVRAGRPGPARALAHQRPPRRARRTRARAAARARDRARGRPARRRARRPQRAGPWGSASRRSPPAVSCAAARSRTPARSADLVPDARALGRRLAAASPGPPGDPPPALAPRGRPGMSAQRKRRPRRTVAPQFRLVAIPAAPRARRHRRHRRRAPHTFRPCSASPAACSPRRLGVLALPSIPDARATVVLLGIGGLAALRHAAFRVATGSGCSRMGRRRTMLALVLVDRAEAEAVPALEGGAPLRPRWREVLRGVGSPRVGCNRRGRSRSCPTVTDRLGRHVWPGLEPGVGDVRDAPAVVALHERRST